MATARQRGALGAAAGDHAGVDGQAVVNVDITHTAAVAVGGQHHIAPVGADGFGHRVAINPVARGQPNLGSGQGAGQLIFEPEVAAVHRDGARRCDGRGQGDGFVFGGFANGHAAVSSAQVPVVGQGEVFDRGGAAGAETQRAAANRFDGAQRGGGPCVQNRICFDGELAGIAGAVAAGAQADAAHSCRGCETHGVVVDGGAARLLQALQVNVATGRDYLHAAGGGPHLNLQTRAVRTGVVDGAFEGNAPAGGFDQMLVTAR